MRTHDIRNALQFGLVPVLTVARTHAAAFADALRRHADQRARRRLAQDTEQWLGSLEARDLRDLGLLRSEIRSIASEAAGQTAATRQRVALQQR